MTTVYKKAKGTILSQTTKAMAVNNVISETASVRILLDTRCQRMYITN